MLNLFNFISLPCKNITAIKAPMKVKDIKIADFDYPLPEEKIARHPLSNRDECKLLVAEGSSGIRHEVFTSLPGLLPSDSLLVCNDTRVINARIIFEKETGSKIEVFLLEPLDPEDYVLMFQSRRLCRWSCLVGNLKRWKDLPLNKKLRIDGRDVILTAMKLNRLPGNAHEIEFAWDDDSLTFASIVDSAGHIPIPPYLKRDSEASDSRDYQTVYAKTEGSVAAPTAGLHFTDRLFDSLKAKGVRVMPVTLHVGAGTFQPVKSDSIGEHPMHTEVFSVTRDLVETLIEYLENKRPVAAVGTTSVRTLESLPYIGHHLLKGKDELEVGQWEAYDDEEFDTIESLKAIAAYLDRHEEETLTASTSIMIAPGFRWRIVDRMITNFHQPQSTLLLLVSSFLGLELTGSERWRSIYEEALRNGYRFLSYGDACYFTR